MIEFQYRSTIDSLGSEVAEQHRYPINCKIDTFIGSDVWIGDNSFIKKGVTIGHGAIVGAASFVTRDVKPFSVVVGNPARHVRYRFEPQIVSELMELQWWNKLSPQDLEGVCFPDIVVAIQQLRNFSVEYRYFVEF